MPVGAAVLSGLLLGCAVRFEQLGGLLWIALVPLIWSIFNSKSYSELALASFLGGLAYGSLALDWIRWADSDAGSLHRTREWFLLSQLCALVWPLVAVTARWLWMKRRVSPLLSLIPLWVAGDFLRVEVSELVDGLGFPYLHLAYAPGVPLVMAQVADLGGIYAVASGIVAINAVIAVVLQVVGQRLLSHGQPKSQMFDGCRLPPVAILSLYVLLVITYGGIRLQQTQVQSGVHVIAMPRHANWKRPHDTVESWRLHSPLPPAAPSIGAAGRVRLCVWPECAFPGTLFGRIERTGLLHADSAPLVGSNADENRNATHAANLRQIADYASRLQSVVVVGCIRQDFSQGGWRRYNSAIVLQPDDLKPRYYDKFALVPGTEGAPRFGAWLGYDSEATFTAGSATPIFEAASAGAISPRFAIAICYDACFPRTFRRYFSASGNAEPPEFFVVPGAESVDRSGWLKKCLLRMTVLRAIETRRPFVRSIDDGYSGLIDGNGQVLRRAAQLQLQSPFEMGNLPVDRRFSFYARLGDWFPVAAILPLVAAGFWPFHSSRRGQQ